MHQDRPPRPHSLSMFFPAYNDGGTIASLVIRAVQVASRLQLAVRANDTVCRLGGDEFVLLLNQLTSPDEHLDILKRATTALCEPVVLKSGAVVQVSTSVGVAIFPRHSTRADELIRLADHAMYGAKKAGRNRIVTYEP